MTKTELIEQSFGLQSASLSFLLLLRIIVDKPESQLEADINDLYLYPGRLQSSYREEWISYIRLQLVKRAFPFNNHTLAKNLNHFIEQQYSIRGEEITAKHERLLRILSDSSNMNNAENIVPINTRFQRSLNGLVQQ